MKSRNPFTTTDVLAHQEGKMGGVRCTCSNAWVLAGHLSHSRQCPRSLLESSGGKSAVLSQTGGERFTGLGKRGEAGPNLPKPVKMSRPEKEMGMMLETQKRAGEIVDYRFQGMSLAYSPDPETGIQLRYKADFVVWTLAAFVQDAMCRGMPPIDPEHGPYDYKIIEVKGFGRHAISAAAKLRFKGAKAAWPMFQFEMHQRCQDGQWRRVL